MSDDEDKRLRLDPSPGAPPPSAALLAAVASMRPVPTRAPGRDLAIALALTLVWAGVWLMAIPLRVDLPHLPRAWLVATALAWAAGLVVPLAVALLPARRQVSPNASLAGLVALLTVAVALALAFLLSPAASGHTIVPEPAEQASRIRHCLVLGLAMGAGAIAIATLAVRRIVVVGPWRLGAAAGAASGALAGLLLELVCPFGGALHVGVGHGGAVLLLAALGALLVPPFCR